MMWVHLVILVSLCEFLVFGFLVGRRPREVQDFGTGNGRTPRFRAHLPGSLQYAGDAGHLHPAILLFGIYLKPRWGALIGAVFIASRALYAIGYIRAPEKREFGALLSFASVAVLLAGALFGVVRAMWMYWD